MSPPTQTPPKLILHGGAGNITRDNLPPLAWNRYSATLLRVHRSTAALLEKGVQALEAATHAVALMEDCVDFNCGRGAVFTRVGTIELEASVMVSRNYRKRGCGVVLVKHVKNPIKLAREILIRGESDGSGDGNEGGDGDPAGGAGGAQGHVCLGGETVERLAKEWGLEMVDEKYFWTKKRWEEHRRGLGKGGDDAIAEPLFPENEEGWDGKEYLPQGTVGCVALDKYGTLCVATSTGGMTNKLPCRIGDTPMIGAGFWAEEWDEAPLEVSMPDLGSEMDSAMGKIAEGVKGVLRGCLPSSNGYSSISRNGGQEEKRQGSCGQRLRAVAISGTGNGDSFLRLSAARTAGAIVRFTAVGRLPSGRPRGRTLASAINQVAGAGGELQRSAGDRWEKNGEGAGGMIGIELRNGKGEVVFDFNCGGMFRCWIDGGGRERVMVFKDEY